MYQQPTAMYVQSAEQQDRDPLMQFAKRWWWLLTIGAIIGLAAAIAYSRLGPIPYQSTALMQVIPPTGATTTEQADQARTASANFAAAAASPRIYAMASQALAGKLDISASDLEAMERDGTLTIETKRGSNFINVIVTDPDPGRAQLIADTIAKVFVDDIAVQAKAAYETRQTQLDEQIKFTRDQLAQSTLLQREIDLKAAIRDQQGQLLNLQTNYQEELGRQVESDAIGDRSSFSDAELAQQAQVRSQLLRAIGQQISDAESSLAAINEELASVQSALATLPPDGDGSLSAAFSEAYSLQLSTLTQRYVTDQITALTQSPSVIQYGGASTPFTTQGIKKISLFGLIGGMAVAAGFGLAFELLRKWRAERALKQGQAPVGADAIPDYERLLAMVDELTNRGMRSGSPRADTPTPAGD